MVGGTGILEQLQGLVQRLGNFLSVDTGRTLPLREIGSLLLDPRLLGGEYVFVDKAFVGKVEQLLLLALEDVELVGSSFGLGLGGFELELAVVTDCLTHTLALFGCQPGIGLVVPLDLGFNEIDRHVGRVAVAAPIELAVALEVFVRAAMALHAAVNHSAPAFAEQRAAEVVLVLSRPVAAEAVRVEQLLYSVERRLIDQPRMLAIGVLDAIEGHDTDVVVVAQDRVDVASAERY